MKWILSAFLLAMGCAEFEEVETRATASSMTVELEEKSHACVAARISCEQMCFQEYGQTWGTLSPLYNACMDECHDQFERCTQRANPVRPKPGYARQFTYSWDQPSSDGVNGYYGYCGPTAASNLLANACGIMLPPRSLAEACFGIGPGTTPGALVGALNDIEGCGHWVVDHANASENDPLETSIGGDPWPSYWIGRALSISIGLPWLMLFAPEVHVTSCTTIGVARTVWTVMSSWRGGV